MGTVLFTWELGGGMGHIMQIKPLVEGLIGQGHRVFLALRDLSAAHIAYGGLSASLIQAPFRHGITSPPFPMPCTYAQILADIGFGDDAILGNFASAWRNLYRSVRPDLVIADHSPTAVLAARGLPAPVVLIGSGFFIPPDVSPFPDLREPARLDAGDLGKEEAPILERANRLLRLWRQKPLERIGQLFSEASERFLVTFEELDHYPGRRDARYWGPVNASGGKAPQWPEGEGPKVYAYLKSFPALPDLLRFLKTRAMPSLVLVDGIDSRIQKEFSSPTLRFERQRLDPDQAACECDLAIINGNHGTATSMLLAGKPTFHLPLFLEQEIIARNIRKIGAGTYASPKRWEPAEEQLQALLSNEHCQVGARRFAAKYRGFSPEQQRKEMLDRVLRLL